MDGLDKPLGEGEVYFIIGLFVEGYEIYNAKCICPEIPSFPASGFGRRSPGLCCGVGGWQWSIDWFDGATKFSQEFGHARSYCEISLPQQLF